ncbi:MULTISPECIES: hypothetical protein [unclassified Clostridium]|uniref:hypothetical protein n=1 Tax=unclassified Clostridium TaxID=2614128 RepID=UPI0025C5DF03|nr:MULTISPECIES: hypothetical protein [unclassified Clostridium]
MSGVIDILEKVRLLEEKAEKVYNLLQASQQFNAALENENEELRNKVIQLEGDIDDLGNENSILEAEIDCLKETIDAYEYEGE